MRHYTESNGTVVLDFTWTDLRRAWAGDYTPETNRWKYEDIREMFATRPGRPKQWYGGLTNPAEVDALLRDGWPEGTRLAREAARGLTVPSPESVRRALRWSDTDGEANTDRWLAGDEKFMRASVRQSRRRPRTVTIYTAIGGNMNESQQSLQWSAVQAVALTDAMEEAGYRVRLVGVWDSYQLVPGRHDDRHSLRITVKEADETLSTDNVVAMLGHAGLLRTVGFVCLTSVSQRVSRGLGSSPPVKVTTGLDEFLLPASTSRQAAQTVIRNTLATLSQGVAA